MPATDEYNGDIYGSTFRCNAHEKNRCNVCFSDNCFSRKKLSRHAVAFSIFTCALVARTDLVVDFDFSFLLNLHIGKKEKSVYLREFVKRICQTRYILLNREVQV